MINEQKIFNTIIFCLCLGLPMFSAYAQNLERSHWFFGQKVNKIRFNRTKDSAPEFTSATMPLGPFGTGGSVAVSDPLNGNLLFYSNGNSVYDASNSVMPNGNGLEGFQNGNQPVVACKVPGQSSKYFIFSNPAPATPLATPPAGLTTKVTVSVVDLSLRGNATSLTLPLGDIETKNIGIEDPTTTTTTNTTTTTTTQGMIIIPHGNGTDFWLVTQKISLDPNTIPNINTYYCATLIEASSYPVTVTSTFTQVVSQNIGEITIVHNFAYHKGSSKLALSPQDVNSNPQILNFDNLTGELTLDRIIPGLENQTIYDMEWSRDGKNIYISRFGDSGLNAGLFLYNLSNPSSTPSSNYTSFYRCFGLQIGPNDTIYHLFQSSATNRIQIGTIPNLENPSNKIAYSSTNFATSSIIGYQFSSFAPPNMENLTVNFSHEGECQNNITTFFPEVQPIADSLIWDFGDQSKSSVWSPNHTFNSGGTFNVTLTAYLNQQKISVTKSVTIKDFPLKLKLVSDTTACHSEFPAPYNLGPEYSTPFSVTVKATSGSAQNYYWSNGQVGETLIPSRPGNYNVVATDTSGCTTYANVQIKDYNKIVNYSSTWHFGDKAGINFNESPPVALDNSNMNAPEGCAVFSDLNGDALLYSDGNSVFDRENSQVATAIGGDVNATQSVIIVPFTGDSTLFYLFTNQNIEQPSQNQIKYSIFDLKVNNGKGGIVKSDVPFFGRSSENIVFNGRWLIFHEFGNNTFRAHSITTVGIGNPVLTALGTDHSFTSLLNSKGYMKLDNNNNLFIATPTLSGNFVEIFNLDTNTGKLGDYKSVNLIKPTGEVYGLAVPDSGDKLFASIRNVTGQSSIIEFNISSFPATKLQELNISGDIGALSVSPLGNIYFARDGSSTLGTITVADAPNTPSQIDENGFDLLPGTSSNLGLPQFNNQNKSLGVGKPSASLSDVCLGDKSKFSGTATDQIDDIEWTFGDPSSSMNSDTLKNPTHLYSTVGNYDITMRLTNRCGLDTTLFNVHKVVEAPITPTVPATDNLCLNPVIILDANSNNLPDYQYLWSTGETSKTVTIITPYNPISVTITNIDGCGASASTVIVDSTPIIDLPDSLSLCKNDIHMPLDAGNPGANYEWTINGTSPSTNQNRVVITSREGDFTYKVVVTDPITSCTNSDSTTFTILPIPNGELPSSVMICNDGENSDYTTNQIELDAGAAFDYEWYKDSIALHYHYQSYIATVGGKYLVKLFDPNGCTNEIKTEVINHCNPIITAPSAFRPETTIEENKFFNVFSFHILNNKFSIDIFNRWGELVFNSNDRSFRWNGGKNNNINDPLAGGEYGYVIRYTSSFNPELGIIEKRGGVTLLR